MSRTSDSLDYHDLLQDALRSIVRSVLAQVAYSGLPGAHHFYISFATDAPGVGLSEELRNKYPEHMTIVLQYDFRDLDVDEEGFSVTLRFGGTPQRISVPFRALVSFYDPSEQFALRFDSARGSGAGEASEAGPVRGSAPVDGDGAPKASPRAPVRAVLAAADRMAAEKAAEALESGRRDPASSDREEGGEGALAERSRRKPRARPAATDIADLMGPDLANGLGAKTRAKKDAARQVTAEGDVEEGDGGEASEGGVVIPFEDFRRR